VGCWSANAFWTFSAPWREHPAVAEYRADLALSHNNLGVWHWNTDQLDEAERAYREALNIRKALVEQDPSVSARKFSIAGRPLVAQASSKRWQS
jgi:hypothetical protein